MSRDWRGWEDAPITGLLSARGRFRLRKRGRTARPSGRSVQREQRVRRAAGVPTGQRRGPDRRNVQSKLRERRGPELHVDRPACCMPRAPLYVYVRNRRTMPERWLLHCTQPQRRSVRALANPGVVDGRDAATRLQPLAPISGALWACKRIAWVEKGLPAARSVATKALRSRTVVRRSVIWRWIELAGQGVSPADGTRLALARVIHDFGVGSRRVSASQGFRRPTGILPVFSRAAKALWSRRTSEAGAKS